MSELDYAGVNDCGCLIAWLSGRLPASDVGGFYGEMTEGGFEVRRITTEAARDPACWSCPTCRRAEVALKSAGATSGSERLTAAANPSRDGRLAGSAGLGTVFESP